MPDIIQFLAVLPISIFAFIALLTIIVFFHEFGHFSMARAGGVRVEVFSIGFGKPLVKWVDRKGTEWRIAPWPFGGYVKFFGDASPASNASDDVARETAPATTQFPRPGEEGAAPGLTPEEKAVCFHFKPVWARALVVAAGPVANFILATAIFWALLISLGDVVYEPRVSVVQPDSAAEEAGFEVGDLLVSVNGRKLDRFDDLRKRTLLSAGETLVIDVERGGEIVTITAVPRRTEIEDAFGNKAEAGVLGIAADGESRRSVRYGPLPALREAVNKVGDVLSSTLKFLGRLILGKEDTRQLGGPVKMAQYAGQSALSGFSGDIENIDFFTRLRISLINFINLAALVSVSIGFLNLLPIPVLDGGHLLYYAYESVAGRPLGAKAQAFGFRVGIVLLASFMLFVTWNDLSNLLSISS